MTKPVPAVSAIAADTVSRPQSPVSPPAGESFPADGRGVLLSPGDVVRCIDCGETVTTLALGVWRSPGDAVFVPWTGGPSPRGFPTHYRPDRCQWCHERHMAVGPSHLLTLEAFIGHPIPNPHVKQEIRMAVPQDEIEAAARSLGEAMERRFETSKNKTFTDATVELVSAVKPKRKKKDDRQGSLF